MTNYTYFIKKADKAFTVAFQSFSEPVQQSIIEAGLGRILNDLVAAGDLTKADYRAKVEAKLEAWARGEVRTSATRTSDPVAKRALELATAAIHKSPAFLKLLQEKGLKVSSKETVQVVRAKAQAMIAVDGNAYVAQARIDVEAQAALGDVDIEF